AARGVVAGELYPQIDATGSYTRTRRSLNSGSFPTGGTSGSTTGFSSKRDFDFFDVGFDSTWEVDVFGGVRREIEAAEADIASAIENRRDVLITLLGDVARNYIELRGRQRQLIITQENLKSQRETLELTRARFNDGLVGDLDV